VRGGLRTLTVAAVRGSEEENHVEVLFLESARVYLLERTRPDFDELFGQLREGRSVRITTAPPDSDVIEDMEVLPEPG
jgi:hypothetical protein